MCLPRCSLFHYYLTTELAALLTGQGFLFLKCCFHKGTASSGCGNSPNHQFSKKKGKQELIEQGAEIPVTMELS